MQTLETQRNTNKNKTTTAVPGKKCENAGENKKSTSAWEPFSWIPQGCARFYIGHAARPPPPLLDWMLASSVQPAHRCQHPEARSSISKAQSVSKKKESVSKKKESVSKKKGSVSKKKESDSKKKVAVSKKKESSCNISGHLLVHVSFFCFLQGV